MRLLFIILIFCCVSVEAQDKLFFKNGKAKTGIIVSIGKDVLYFKNSDTSATQRINKSDLLLAENYKGTRYLFGKENAEEIHSTFTKITHRNVIGVQPFGIFLGRMTLTYERLSKDGTIGLVIPISLSFNVWQGLKKLDTIAVVRKSGVNFIGGADLNFYFGSGDHSKFFIGPRVRFGTDVFLSNTEGYSMQTQIGWKFENSGNRLVQHLSVGFGFLKIISSSALIADKRTYGCYSLTYRLGIKW